jgi:hypothetical protein
MSRRAHKAGNLTNPHHVMGDTTLTVELLAFEGKPR